MSGKRSKSSWPENMDPTVPPPMKNRIIVPRNDIEVSQYSEEYMAYEGGPLRLAGYMYYPTTNKYYKITRDNYGGPRDERAEHERREKARAARMAAVRAKEAQARQKKPFIGLDKLTEDLSISRRTAPEVKRRVDEDRLRNCSKVPTFCISTPCDQHSIQGCQFLDITNNGDKVVGLYQMGNNVHTPRHSAVYVFDMKHDNKLFQKECQRKEMAEMYSYPNDIESGFNTLGLNVEPIPSDDNDDGNPMDLPYWQRSDLAVRRFSDFIVDQTIAKVDSDVTCMLVALASDSQDKYGRMMSHCAVELFPISQFSNPESFHCLPSPIYNKRFQQRGHIWSISWNAQGMQVGLGLEHVFRIENILTRQNFILSSRRRNVLASSFSPDGKLVYMGLRGDDVIRSDLRMNRDRITGSLKGSKSSAYVKVLEESHPDCVLTESFDAKIQLWDFRYPSKPIMSMIGHNNEQNRVPMFVDKKEKYLFAAGCDSNIRGFSLTTGELLCTIKTPTHTISPESWFPHMVYSENWGNRHGNAGLMISFENTMRFHALSL